MSSSGLQPDPSQVDQVIQILKQTQSPNNIIQKEVRENLAILQSNQEFNGYLAHVLTLPHESVDASIRSAGGLLLKNNCLQYFNSFSDSIKSVIIESIFKVIGDPFTMIRSTAASLLSCVVRADHFKCWLNIVYPNLLANISMPITNEVRSEGSILAIQRLLEDYDGNINDNITMTCAIELLYKCGQLFVHPDINLRLASSNCFSTLLYNSVPLDETSLNDLFVIADDEDSRIRKNVCKCLVMIVHREIETLFSCFGNFMQYILNRINDQDQEVAIEACEVWSALVDQPLGRDLMEPYISKLAPLLLSKMKYVDDDLAIQDTETNDFADICVQSKSAHKSNANDSDEDSEDEVHGNDTWNSGSLQWNLRKGAASTLDQLSHLYSDQLLPHLLPSLQNAMLSQDWIEKESAILALGAISEGCYESMTVYMPQILPFLFQCLNDPKHLVRSISCWTTGRYCSWIVEQEDSSYFNQALNNLLLRIKDPNARVQEAACSAFAILEEESGLKLIPFIPQIVEAFSNALRLYKSRNLLILFDAIGTLTDCTRGNVDPQIFIDTLAPILIQILQKTKDDDPSMFSLLECLTSIAGACGKRFMPSIEIIFHRCAVIIQTYLQNQIQCNQQSSRFNDGDFLIVPLDSISSLAASIGSDIEPLIRKYQIVNFLNEYLCNNTISEVRQSALALVGDLAKSCIGVLKDILPNMLIIFQQSLDPASFVALKNNAIWALGEIICRLSDNEAASYITPLIPSILQIITSRLCQKPLADNTAITIGKICLKCPETIVDKLNQFIHIWLRIISGIHDTCEKEQALYGVCRALKLNPNSLLDNFSVFCEAIVSFRDPINPEVKHMLQEILNGYRTHIGEDQWQTFKSTLNNNLRQQLVQKYNA